MSAFVIAGMEVSGANALACPWVVNAAHVIAPTLFAHNCARQMNLSGERVCIVHHDAQLLGEYPEGKFYNFHPQQRRGATFINRRDYSSKNKHALSMQPTASFHWYLSLIVEIEGAVDVELKRFLRHAKLAGGKIIGYEKIVPVSDEEEMRAALPRHSPSYFIVERRDLMTLDPDPLESLIQALTLKLSVSSDEDPAEADADVAAKVSILKKTSSWLTPAVLGYAALTEFESRRGVRLLDAMEEPLHAFCEPLVGLVQYISLNDYGAHALPFWRYNWPRPDTFVVEQYPSI